MASRLFGGAFLGDAAFCVLKAFEWQRELAAGNTPSTNTFFMYYYVLTGLHLFHVVIGMTVLGYAIHTARTFGTDDNFPVELRPTLALENQNLVYIEGGACFWHMVDLIWIVLFPLLYLIK
ncbi:MAG TPA: cytochrome c oxidase subunit 3 [Pseudonocardia sp.]|nr:cytochrome c oxidase subunit 3 [Pseudonocardia sp.]